MITLKDSIEVEATPEKVFNWLVQRLHDKESYQAWHPDHVDIRWIKGEALQEGSILYAEEYLHGVLHKLKFRITKVVPNRLIEYRSLFPLSLPAPGNSFIIEPKGEGQCVFTAIGSLRLPRWLFERLHPKHKGKIKATERHMREEGENLKRALEAGGGSVRTANDPHGEEFISTQIPVKRWSNSGTTTMSTQTTESLETVTKILLRCWIFGFLLLLFWWGTITLAGDLTLGLHSDMFDLTRHQLNVIHYCGMGLLKLAVGVFFFIPWVSIKLVLRKSGA